MGAGVKRWWIPPTRLADECAEWSAQQRVRLSQAILHTPATKVRLLKPMMTAWVKLWMTIAGQTEEPERPPPTSIPTAGVKRHG